MALKTFRPTSPGRRALVIVQKTELWKGAPVKALVKGAKKDGGRNSNGRITIRHQGGGHKQKHRTVDLKRDHFDAPAKVERLEYDPFRTAYIALVTYEGGEQAYILAPQKLAPGDTVISSKSPVDIKPGNATSLKNIPVGAVVHNIEMKPGKGGQMARAAGAYAQIVGRDGTYVQVKLGSGELRMVHAECIATIGAVSNPDHLNENLGKAGRKRWMGVRPTVRGVAMNPIDHPHGGGEGRTSGGRHPVTPWGKPTKGYRTRKPKPSDTFIIKRRHKS